MKKTQLTEQETEIAISNAKKAKYFKIKREEFYKKLIEPKVYPKYNAEQLYQIVIERGRQLFYENGKGEFVLDQDNQEMFKLLSWYFTGDTRFEQADYSLRKGLFIFGPIGCGKTFSMQLFSSNPRQSFCMVECRKVAQAFSELGDDGLEKYATHFSNTYMNGEAHFGQRQIGWCFDDLGTEGKVKHYGNEKNAMEQVLMSWHLKMFPNPMVHLTSNLTAQEIEDFYGARLRSRMREMFNVIEFPAEAKDRRL